MRKGRRLPQRLHQFFWDVVPGRIDLAKHSEYVIARPLEHGEPKSARVIPGGHMGKTPETLPTIIRWLKRELV